MHTTKFSPSLIGDKTGVSACINLRHDNATGCLVAVGHPVAVDAHGYKPLAAVTVDPGDSEAVIFTRENSAKIIETGRTATMLTLTAPPLTAIQAAPSSALLMLADGTKATIKKTATDNWSVEPQPLPHSPLALTAIDLSPLSAQVGATSLTGAYDARSTALTALDISRISDAASGGYKSLCDIAAAAGAYIQPMIGRYRLIDGEGSILYSSAPVVLGPGCGVNCLDTVTATLSASDPAGYYDTLAPFAITATPFKVALRLDCATTDHDSLLLLEKAARIEVMLSPQLHPVDPAATASCRLERTHSEARVAITLPGTSAGLTPAHSVLYPTVMSLMARLSTALTTAAVLQPSVADFSTADMLLVVPRQSATTLADDRKAVASLLARKPDTVAAAGSLQSVASAPHSFSASCSATAGATVMWGDITTRLFDGYSPCEMARTVYPTPRPAKAQVVIPPSTFVNRDNSAATCSPLSLSPLLCYPLATATRLRMLVAMPDDTRRYLNLPLVTMPGCPYAFYLNPSLRPIDVDTDGAVSPDVVFPPTAANTARHPGSVITASLSAPLLPVGAATIDSATVRAVAPAMRDTSGWNFSHLRFCAFTPHGVLSLRVDSGLRVSAPTLLFQGSASGAHAVVGGKTYCVVDEALVMLDGGKATTLIERGVSRVGYCAPFDELWVRVSGTTRVYRPGYTTYYCRDIADIADLRSIGRHLFITRYNGALLDTATEARDDTAIRWNSRQLLPARTRPRMLDTIVQASRYNGAITLRADSGAGTANALAIVGIAIDGPINAPVAARLVSPPRRYATLELNATVSPDFSFTSATLFHRP